MIDDFEFDDDLEIDDLPEIDLPEEEFSLSEDYEDTPGSTYDDESIVNSGQCVSDYNPSFGANLYTKHEIASKIKEANDKIDYYKSQEVSHAKRAHGIFEEGELSSVREAHRNVEKWKAIKKRWENETPKDK